MKSFRHALLALSVVASFAAQAAPNRDQEVPDRLDLPSALRFALENNFAIRQARERVNEAEGGVTTARAGQLPQASIDVVRAAAAGGIPLLGVCLGHQAIGEAFGATVDHAPELMHGMTSLVHHDSSPLYAGLPDPFIATRYHSLIVERGSLPDCLEVTAETNGLIMGMQHKTHPVHGVQFHPESIASEHGHALLANFLELAGMAPRRRNAPAARVAAA